jgi:thiamine-phosphate pyrophosphorylase
MLAPCGWQTWRVPPGLAELRERLRTARLYLVCDALPEAKLDAALRGGVDLVQLRMKAAAEPEIVATARRFAVVCQAHGVPLILNDRPELVVPAGADGVHVGQDDMPVAQARAVIGPARLVGLSTHTPAQIDAAAGVDVDYIGVGPVHATPTKPGRAAVGTELVTHAARAAQVPFFAIGGIDRQNVAAVIGAGARAIAVVRAITESRDPERAAAELRAAMETEAGVGAA